MCLISLIILNLNFPPDIVVVFSLTHYFACSIHLDMPFPRINQFANKIVFHDFMITRIFRRKAKGRVAPIRKTKISIPTARYRVLRNFTEILRISALHFGKKDLYPKFEFINRSLLRPLPRLRRGVRLRLTRRPQSSRSGEFKFKPPN